MTGQGQIRVLLVDDHSVVRAGLRLIIDGQTDMEVVAEASTIKDATFEARAGKPGVIVLDLEMPDGSGLDAIPALLHESPESRVVILSLHDGSGYVREAFRLGAVGYIPKGSVDADLIDGIRKAATGAEYVAPTLGATLAHSNVSEPVPEVELLPIDERILRLVALGHTNAEIGKSLQLHPRNVERRRIDAMRKLVLHTRAELVRYAMRRGWFAGENRGG